jgi:hypothetical protein
MHKNKTLLLLAVDRAANPIGSPTTGSKIYSTASPLQSHTITTRDTGVVKIQITANTIVNAEIDLLP